MKSTSNLSGQKFGKLRVLNLTCFKNASQRFLYECLCDCGRSVLQDHAYLKRITKTVRSCGCISRPLGKPKGVYPNLVGQVFGFQTITSQDVKRGKYFFVSCVCGDTFSNKSYTLSAIKRRASCGCASKEGIKKTFKNNLVGKTFYALTVLYLSTKQSGKGWIWMCQCKCGNLKAVPANRLIGKSCQMKSCGCLKGDPLGLNLPKLVGEKNPKWKGGVSTLNQSIRSCDRFNIWRNAVFSRDLRTCKICFSKDILTLNAHHIIELSTIIKRNDLKTMEDAYTCEILWDASNGLTVCTSCHADIHGLPQLKNFKYKKQRQIAILN